MEICRSPRKEDYGIERTARAAKRLIPLYVAVPAKRIMVLRELYTLRSSSIRGVVAVPAKRIMVLREKDHLKLPFGKKVKVAVPAKRMMVLRGVVQYTIQMARMSLSPQRGLWY